MLEKGLVQIYTGHGKGKTTAAFGLALRAAGRDNKVLIYQFLKPPALEIGERLVLQRETLGIRIEAIDVAWDMSASAPDEKAVAEMKIAISEVLARIAEMAQNRLYDLLILDEIVFCLSRGLAKLQDVENIINRRYPTVEIVLTGRGATPELIELADLVTRVKEKGTDEGLSNEVLDAAAQRMVLDTQFPLTIATRRIWWGTRRPGGWTCSWVMWTRLSTGRGSGLWLS